MGVVFKAVDTRSERTVAIKLHQFPPDSELIARFHREARLLSKLNHPGIVRVLDSGRIESILFLSMELLDGHNLSDLVAAQGGLPVSRATALVAQAAEALAYLHVKGLMHRDIKPSNLMVDDKDHLTITDFGLVRALESTLLTPNGAILGTPRFIPPEVIFGGIAGFPQDVYSLALTLHELIVGEAWFHCSGFPEMVGRILRGPPPRLIDSRVAVPDWLLDLQSRALDSNPRSRPTAAAFRDELLAGIKRGFQPESAVVAAQRFQASSGGLESTTNETGTIQQLPRGLAARYRIVSLLSEGPRGRQYLAQKLRAGMRPTGVGALLGRPIVTASIALCACVVLMAGVGGFGRPTSIDPGPAVTPTASSSPADWRIARVELLEDSLAVRVSRSSEAGVMTTEVRMYPPPVYPCDVPVPETLSGPRQRVALSSHQVASALLERLTSLPKLCSQLSIRSDIRPGNLLQTLEAVAPTRELLWQALTRSGLLSPWRLVSTHARPILASSLEPAIRRRILKSVDVLEDLAATLELYGLPVELPLQSIRPLRQTPSWNDVASDRVRVVPLRPVARGRGHRVPTRGEWEAVRSQDSYTLFPVVDFSGEECLDALASRAVPRGLEGTFRLTAGSRPRKARKAWIVLDTNLSLGKLPPHRFWISPWARVNEEYEFRIGSQLTTVGPRQTVAAWNSFDPSSLRTGENRISLWGVSLVPARQIVDATEGGTFQKLLLVFE